MVGLVQAASDAGLTQSGSEVLSFRTPPVLGGVLEPENLELADFVVAVNLAGQLHERTSALPPGAPITGFSID